MSRKSKHLLKQQAIGEYEMNKDEVVAKLLELRGRNIVEILLPSEYELDLSSGKEGGDEQDSKTEIGSDGKLESTKSEITGKPMICARLPMKFKGVFFFRKGNFLVVQRDSTADPTVTNILFTATCSLNRKQITYLQKNGDWPTDKLFATDEWEQELEKYYDAKPADHHHVVQSDDSQSDSDIPGLPRNQNYRRGRIIYEEESDSSSDSA